MHPTDSRPVPVPDPWSAPYWDAARRHTLVVQRCTGCGRGQYPPDAFCRYCQGDQFTYDPIPGRGRIYTFAVFNRSFMPVFEAPYTLALVDIDGDDRLRMLTNIVGVDPADVEIDMPVEVAFEDRAEATIPQFRPIATVR